MFPERGNDGKKQIDPSLRSACLPVGRGDKSKIDLSIQNDLNQSRLTGLFNPKSFGKTKYAGNDGIRG